MHEWNKQTRRALLGRRVRVKGSRAKAERKIVGAYTRIPGGVLLDKDVLGFRSWNLDALVFVESEDS